MGMFTWKMSDTGRTLVSDFADVPRKWKNHVCTKATLLLPNGEKLTGEYNGYGCLLVNSTTHKDAEDVIDIFAAVAKALVDAGVLSVRGRLTTEDDYRAVFFKNYGVWSKLICLVEDKSLQFSDVGGSAQCSTQGFRFEEFDPE